MNRKTDTQLRVKPCLAVLVLSLGVVTTLPARAQTVWFENFESVELGPNVDEGLVGTKVWGKKLEGWVADDSGVPGTDTGLDGVTEWAGWSFADKEWWISTAGDQRRSEFTRSSGVALIADPDEWDDQAHEDSESNGWYQTFLSTPAIDISGQDVNSLFLGFDSSWRPEFDSNYRQSGRIWAQFDGAERMELLTWLSDGQDLNYKDDMSTNEYVLAPLSNPNGASEVKLVFEMFDAGNDWWWAIDNVSIGVPPLVGGVDVSPVGFTVSVIEAENVSVVENSIKLTLDGNPLSIPGGNISRDFVEDTVGATPLDEPLVEQVDLVYSLPQGEFFAPGSEHDLGVEFSSSAGDTTSSTIKFKVPVFPLVTPEFKTDGETAGTGFSGRVVQADQAHGSRIAGAERFLAGLELSCATGDVIGNIASETGAFEVATINLDEGGANAGSITGDSAVPGIPGATGSADNFAAEFVGYLELERGVHRFGVNSADGFQLRIGRNPRDVFALELTSFDGARGAADSMVDFAVEEKGIYAFRLLWFAGNGAASVEFFSVDFETGDRTLINGSGGLVSKSQGPNPAYVDWILPQPGVGIAPDTQVGFKLVSGDDEIDADSAELWVDGIKINAEVTVSDESVTVLWTPSELLVSSASHLATLSYSVGGQVETKSWEFDVLDYFTIPGAAGTALGTGSDPGMLWRTHQLGSSRGNSIVLAEQQLAGDLGENEYDDFGFDSNGFIDIPFVNFEQGAGNAGNFNADAADVSMAVPDEFIPGIPGLNGSTDNIAAEAYAYLEVSSPGIQRMVVNSDDGFQVSVGTPADPTWAVLGAFDGGRGSADTLFAFNVEEAGVYFFRLLWFEGGGGANVEWFTVTTEGCRTLVGDAQSDLAVKSFKSRSVAEPVLPEITVTPLPGGEITGISLAEDGSVTIEFTGALESASTVNGTFAPVSDAVSPYTVDQSRDAQFYIAR